MFRRESVMRVLPYCQETGYLFELEILLWLHRMAYRMTEVQVFWRDVPGTKVRLGRDSLRMLRGLMRLYRLLRQDELFIAV